VDRFKRQYPIISYPARREKRKVRGEEEVGGTRKCLEWPRERMARRVTQTTATTTAFISFGYFWQSTLSQQQQRAVTSQKLPFCLKKKKETASTRNLSSIQSPEGAIRIRFRISLSGRLLVTYYAWRRAPERIRHYFTLFFLFFFFFFFSSPSWSSFFSSLTIYIV
jgi:hypothetical protein